MIFKSFCELFVLICLFQFGNCKSPHIIFIMADDLGWNDVAFHGSIQIPTPNIDALAYAGVILNNYYVQPLCTPSRGALMSGLYPMHTGLQHGVIISQQPYGLPLNITLLPSYLNDLGYESRIVGKWHLGYFEKEYTPTYRGFHQHYGYWSARHDYYDHTAYDEPYWGYDFRRNMEVDRTAYGYYTTDLLTDEAVSIISNHNSSQPLFLYMAHLAMHCGNPHDPIQAPADVVDRFSYIEDEKRRKFAGSLTKMDESIGFLLEALSNNSMLDDSVIVFSTDNGGPAAGRNFNAASNWPLRGVKASMWEGGIRGAACIWSPLINASRRVSNQMMHIVDWMPTLVAAAGGDPDSLPANDGLNMWPAIVNNETSPRSEILQNIDPELDGASIRMGDWKLVFTPQGDGPEWDDWFGPSGRDPEISKHRKEISNNSWDLRSYYQDVLNSKSGRAIMNIKPDAFRMMHEMRTEAEVLCDPVPSNASTCYNNSSPCLFHIPSDPCEYNDVSATNPDIVQLLQTRLSQYNETAVPLVAKPDDPKADPKYWNYTWTNWKDFTQPAADSQLFEKRQAKITDLV